MSMVKEIVDQRVKAVAEKLSLKGSHYKYKAMRAIAFQAFSEYIENGEFDSLVERAVENHKNLPYGWVVSYPGAKNEAKNDVKIKDTTKETVVKEDKPKKSRRRRKAA